MYAFHETGAPAGEVRDGFRFRGGNLALDLTATLLGRLRPVHNELLKTPDDLRRWLSLSELKLDVDAVTENMLQSARLLREAIYELVTAHLSGIDFPREVVGLLNDMTARPCIFPRMDDNGGMRMEGGVDAALALIAQQAIFLLGGEWACRIRQCHGDFCTILFLDMSRKGDRRWCSMAACGNKAKIAEYRKRKKETG